MYSASGISRIHRPSSSTNEAQRGAVDAPVAADVDELCALLCGPDR